MRMKIQCRIFLNLHLQSVQFKILQEIAEYQLNVLNMAEQIKRIEEFAQNDKRRYK